MTLRDIAVFIAYFVKKQELGKGWLANEWIEKKFELNDAGHIRKCRANARNVVGKKWIVVTFTTQFICLFPSRLLESGNIFICAGTVGWLWPKDAGEPVLEVELAEPLSMPGPSAAGSPWGPGGKKEQW